jgi:hypothetical protein
MPRSWNSPPIIASQIGKASWSHTWHGVIMTQRAAAGLACPANGPGTSASACPVAFPSSGGGPRGPQGGSKGSRGTPRGPHEAFFTRVPPWVSSPGAHRLYILLLGLGAGDDHRGVDAALGRVVLAGDELGASKGVSLERRKSARAFLREYSDKRRHLNQFLGQLGDFLTW